MIVRKGFTLVEMTVVMAIVAILSLVGVYALITARNDAAVDSATQSTVSAIREAQNKAISVANVPGDSTPPVAWGVFVNSSTSAIQPFYIKKDLSYNIAGLSETKFAISSISASGYYVFSAPFGKYYSSDDPPDNTHWVMNLDRPKDAIFNGTAAPNTFTINLKGSQRTITIDTKGDVSVQ